MNHKFWKNKNVLVTGGTGFIGSHLVEKLVDTGANVSILDKLNNNKQSLRFSASPAILKQNLSSNKLKNISRVIDKVKLINGDCSDLSDSAKACKNQHIVMNLAALVGGIEYNRTHQATMLRANFAIAATMIEAAKQSNVERFLVVSSACIYPRNCSIPTPESDGFLDEPEPTNGGYGWAKRMAEKLGMYYAKEYKMKVAIVRPYNCYGPRDHFDPLTSHVIPALIKRILDGESPLIVWGSGKQTRAFLYVEDLAKGMMMAIEKYPQPDPINLGTDEEITIKDLVHKIVKISGISPKIIFDSSKPDGSPRRNSDNRKSKHLIDFTSQIGLDEGLQKTIEWYKKNIINL